MRSTNPLQVCRAPSETSWESTPRTVVNLVMGGGVNRGCHGDYVLGNDVVTAYDQIGDWVRVPKLHKLPQWINTVTVCDNGHREREVDANSRWWWRMCRSC